MCSLALNIVSCPSHLETSWGVVCVCVWMLLGSGGVCVYGEWCVCECVCVCVWGVVWMLLGCVGGTCELTGQANQRPRSPSERNQSSPHEDQQPPPSTRAPSRTVSAVVSKQTLCHILFNLSSLTLSLSRSLSLS